MSMVRERDAKRQQVSPRCSEATKFVLIFGELAEILRLHGSGDSDLWKVKRGGIAFRFEFLVQRLDLSLGAHQILAESLLGVESVKLCQYLKGYPRVERGV